MDKLDHLRLDAQRALNTLQEVLAEPFSVIVRDAAIQRFEYTFEVCWKLARTHLKEYEGIVSNSPKNTFRKLFEAGLLDEEQTSSALEMTDDRNRTVHTYHEAVAEAIFARLSDHVALLGAMAKKLM